MTASRGNSASGRPGEVTQTHTRLLKCTLDVDDARAYWPYAGGAEPPDAQRAFEDYWFGARSLRRVEELLRVMRARYDAFPHAAATLRRWRHMGVDTRLAICHWHVQLADPLYRKFSGDFLVARRAGMRATVTRDVVFNWLGQHCPDRWSMATRIQFASKLLSTAHSAGLVASIRDPRSLTLPTVPPEALEYLLYLLRGVEFRGSLFDNPYLASVGIEGSSLEYRLRRLPGLDFDRQGDLVALDWRYPDLLAWSEANLPADWLTPQHTLDEGVA